MIEHELHVASAGFCGVRIEKNYWKRCHFWWIPFREINRKCAVELELFTNIAMCMGNFMDCDANFHDEFPWYFVSFPLIIEHSQASNSMYKCAFIHYVSLSVLSAFSVHIICLFICGICMAALRQTKTQSRFAERCIFPCRSNWLTDIFCFCFCFFVCVCVCHSTVYSIRVMAQRRMKQLFGFRYLSAFLTCAWTLWFSVANRFTQTNTIKWRLIVDCCRWHDIRKCINNRFCWQTSAINHNQIALATSSNWHSTHWMHRNYFFFFFFGFFSYSNWMLMLLLGPLQKITSSKFTDWRGKAHFTRKWRWKW